MASRREVSPVLFAPVVVPIPFVAPFGEKADNITPHIARTGELGDFQIYRHLSPNPVPVESFQLIVVKTEYLAIISCSLA